MAFTARAVANNRFEIMDTTTKTLLCIALGRKAGDIIIEALTARFGEGEQMSLELDDAAA
jgi:hypothetical protein